MALEATAFESIHPSRFISFTIPNPSCLDSLLRVAVLDSPDQPTDTPQVGAMLVPEGREADWIFSTESGQLQLLLSSPGISRLILIGNQLKEGDFSPREYHRPLNCSLHQHGIEAWSKPLLLALSPRSLFRNGIPEIPLLSYEDNLVSSVLIHKCKGCLVGEMLIEDVEIESKSDLNLGGCLRREFRRRLRFKRMPNLIQTEIRMVPAAEHSCDSIRIGDAGLMPDHRVLVHPYLAPMVASLSLISEYVERQRQNGIKPKALCLGVGGGALLTFLKIQLGFEVVGVESDRAVLSIAKHHFGLEERGESILVFVGDGIEYMKKLASCGDMNCVSSSAGCDVNGFSHLWNAEINRNFDVVMVDLDSSDIRNGTSSPPLEFVARDVLLAAKLVLSECGILVINVIPPSKSFYDKLVNHLHQVFCELFRIDVGNGENFVLIATVVSPQAFPFGDFSNSFFMLLKSVIPEAFIDSISKI